jgi:hypothetical protein
MTAGRTGSAAGGAALLSWYSTVTWAASEQQLQIELELPLSSCAEVRIVVDVVGGPGDELLAEYRAGISKVRMVQEVKGICSKLKTETLVDREILSEREIPLTEAWRGNAIARASAEGADGGLGKTAHYVGSVEIVELGDELSAAIRDVVNFTRAADVVESEVRQPHGVVPSDYTGELPVVQDLARCAGEMGLRNLIDVGEIDRLRHIKLGVSAAESQIHGVAWDEAAGAECVRGFRGVIDIVSPGIAELGGESVIVLGAQEDLQ